RPRRHCAASASPRTSPALPCCWRRRPGRSSPVRSSPSMAAGWRCSADRVNGGEGMAFSLIEDDAGAVPVTVLTKAGLEAWRETAPRHARDWARATGVTGEAGKLALVPDDAGKLGHVLVGRA